MEEYEVKRGRKCFCGHSYSMHRIKDGECISKVEDGGGAFYWWECGCKKFDREGDSG